MSFYYRQESDAQQKGPARQAGPIQKTASEDYYFIMGHPH
jgi:hypothetical protein